MYENGEKSKEARLNSALEYVISEAKCLWLIHLAHMVEQKHKFC